MRLPGEVNRSRSTIHNLPLELSHLHKLVRRDVIQVDEDAIRLCRVAGEFTVIVADPYRRFAALDESRSTRALDGGVLASAKHSCAVIVTENAEADGRW